MPRKWLGMIMLALALLTGGCWDRTEIEDTAYVISLGVDAAGEGEYLWTMRVVEAEKLPVGILTSSASQEAGTMASGVVTIRAKTIEQAIQVAQASLVRVLSLDHLRNVLVSEEVAAQGLSSLLSQLLRHNEVRRGAGIQVANGRADEMFKWNLPVGEANPAKFVEGILLVQKRVHLSPPTRLQHFHARLNAPGADPVLPLVGLNPLAMPGSKEEIPPFGDRSLWAGQFPRRGGNPLEVAGTAVFRGDRMVGKLSVNETTALLSLRGEMGKTYQSFPNPLAEGEQITLRLGQENKPRFRTAMQNGRPTVDIWLQLDAELLGSTVPADYADLENRRRLERAVTRFAVEDVYRPLLKKVYGEWGADPVGLGQLFRRRFATFNDWLAYRWHDHVKDVQITVDGDVYIRRFGLILDDAAPEESRGE